ncbi:MAG: shikimate dehydrogenase [Gammaproteobacteria bacterium]|nr:shikimate dehydrogenase [Gammaproteobacteria bacterium]MBI5615401.1 shikimate dehydrogenase [Gammaproteobacteria bacterium]
MTGLFHPEPGVPYFCVVGSPIAHSRSPQIHALFAAQLGLRLTYERVEVQPGDLAGAVRQFRALGGQGMNVTVPLKEEACRLADRMQPAAAEAGAANTLWFEDGGVLVADNTDGAGLLRDLDQNLGIRMAGKRILVIGAGGASRGVLPVILRSGPAALLLANRTLAKAQEVAERFKSLGNITAQALGVAASEPYDLIINATSTGLTGECAPLGQGAVGRHTSCYDMVYAAEPTPFLRDAARLGAKRCVDGLGMLVEQAALAFAIWHDREPRTRPVIEAIRSLMATASPS